MYVCMVVLYEHFLDIDYGDCQSLGELKTYDIAPLLPYLYKGFGIFKKGRKFLGVEDTKYIF